MAAKQSRIHAMSMMSKALYLSTLHSSTIDRHLTTDLRTELNMLKGVCRDISMAMLLALRKIKMEDLGVHLIVSSTSADDPWAEDDMSG